MDTEPRQLILPESGYALSSSTVSVSSNGPIVIVGANGSGKTRLGSWIELESGQQENVHRISAQKSLVMPEFASPTSAEKAEHDLFYGHPDPQRTGYRKIAYRWGQNPNTYLLSDYDKLVNFLFSDENRSNAKYKQKSRQAPDRIEPPESKLDITKRIWEEILPHRRLVTEEGKVETEVSDRPEALYNASQMSDGERVIFYLIGQALSAPQDGIIVIDEPEIHLHRSIQAILWDKVEAERPDCLFVYLTHDLDFAASRVAATKVCLRSYADRIWDWYEVPQNDEIPEEVFLEILGSRKPVIFVEGDKSSLDYFLFQKLYPDFVIAPCGGADQVIHATRSFSNFESFHRHTSYGIIDRDFRDEGEVQHLRGRSVFVLDFSEIENLLLSEEFLRMVARHLELESTFPDLLAEVKDVVFRQMTHNRERLISSITATKIEQELKSFDAKTEGKAELGAALADLTSSIDVDALYDSSAREVDKVISDRNYAQALRIYNNKGLLPQIAPSFGFTSSGLLEFIKRRVSSGKGGDLLAAIRNQVPSIPT